MDEQHQLKITSSAIETIKSKLKTLKFESSYENIPIAEINNGNDIPDILLSVGKQYVYIYRKDITDKNHIHAPVQVGRVQIDQEGNPLNFIKNREDSLISETFDMLSNIRFFSDIRNKYGVPNLGEDSKQEALKIKREENAVALKKQREIDDINLLATQNRLNNPRQKIEILNDDIVGSISQGEIGFVNSKNDQKKYLETLGAGPCIIITAFSKGGSGAMVHIDALTDEKTVLTKLLSYAKDEVRVFGGDNSSIEQLVSIKKELDIRNIKVLEWDILNSSKSIIMNCETGEVFDVLNPKNRPDASQQNSLDMYMRGMQGKQPAKIKKFD